MNNKKKYFLIVFIFAIFFISYKAFKAVYKVKIINKFDYGKDSALAHKYLDGLHGVEIGGAAHNPFHIRGSINVDYTANEAEIQSNWSSKSVDPMPVNLVANGDDLPFKDSTIDYVLSSHVIEHFFDPIKTLKEWIRVVKPGGYIFIIAPHKERTFDKYRPITPIAELSERHSGLLKVSDYAENEKCDKNNTQFAKESKEECVIVLKDKSLPGYKNFKEDDHHHWTVWNTESFLELCKYLKLNVVEFQNVDDKVGNGFTIVIKK